LRDALRALPAEMPLPEQAELGRLMTLLGIINQWKHGEPTDEFSGLRVWPIDWVVLDINTVLRKVNEGMDANATIAACRTYSEARRYEPPAEWESEIDFIGLMTLHKQPRGGEEHLKRGRRGRAAYTQPIADEIALVTTGDARLRVLTFANHTRSQVDEQLLELMIALRLHKFDHGAYPESLFELVPQYLGKVPDDPFDGATMRYYRRGKGCVVYSVGPNQLDEAGQGWDYRPPDYDEWIDDADDIAVALGVPSAYDEVDD
jgi:hypothetical protein